MAILTIVASQDNFSLSHAGSQSTNYGTWAFVYPAMSYTNYTRRGFFKFPITWGTDIPAGATITAATFSVYHYANAAGDPDGIALLVYKQTHNDWVETEQTWSIYKTGSSWSTAGGDYVTSSPAGGSTNFGSTGNWVDINILAIAQDAQTNSIDVNLITKFASEGSGDIEPMVYSRDYTGDTSLRPKLVITYTVTTSSTTSSTTTSTTSSTTTSSTSTSTSTSTTVTSTSSTTTTVTSTTTSTSSSTSTSTTVTTITSTSSTTTTSTSTSTTSSTSSTTSSTTSAPPYIIPILEMKAFNPILEMTR